MTRLVFDDDADRLPSGAQGNSSGIVPVLLYGRRPPGQGTACVGGPVVSAVRRLGVPAHPSAFDLLTIAMAVTAADTFVDRRQAADGWARELALEIPLAVPTPWQRVMPTLQAALNFLSGDIWSFTFTDRGPRPPAPQVRGHLTRLEGHDCTSLFSGGLDSAIGVLDLLRSGRRPVLISHSYSGDAKRQGLIRGQLPVDVSQFSAMANPVSKLEGVSGPNRPACRRTPSRRSQPTRLCFAALRVPLSWPAASAGRSHPPQHDGPAGNVEGAGSPGVPRAVAGRGRGPGPGGAAGRAARRSRGGSRCGAWRAPAGGLRG